MYCKKMILLRLPTYRFINGSHYLNISFLYNGSITSYLLNLNCNKQMWDFFFPYFAAPMDLPHRPRKFFSAETLGYQSVLFINRVNQKT